MKSVIGVLFLVAGSLAVPTHQSFSLQNDGSYKFAYDTSKETGSHQRTEVKGPDGLVIGKFSYEDPTGDLRVVNYKAGDFGYIAKGAVGVAGAPESQFPAELEAGDATDIQRDTGNDDEQKGAETKSDEPSDNEDYTDDVKAMKFQLPLNGVPEGFPPGFFDQGFHGLRRLPEPTKEESDEEEDKKEENEVQSNSDKADDKKEETKHGSPFEYFPPILPFANFHPHTWSAPFYHTASSQQKPVYVYSYQMPQAHGYYYYY